MSDFVSKNSIVRKIWGNGDTVLYIFSGAAAEFALNKAVDWLYFTGRLPADPIGRLFSTVTYARAIIFSENESALRAIDKITAIHAEVETKRGAKIPDWAYRDVLFMLIDYSIRSYEILQRKMTHAEKCDVFQVFLSVGNRMNLAGLPVSYESWLTMRKEHMKENLARSTYTVDLFKQYEKKLGSFRYMLLRQGQWMVVPVEIRHLLPFQIKPWLGPMLSIYKILRILNMHRFFRNAILPGKYMEEIRRLDVTLYN